VAKNRCCSPFVLKKEGVEQAEFARFGIHAPNHGQAQERRVCVLRNDVNTGEIM
jgi:hypothetical protein